MSCQAQVWEGVDRTLLDNWERWRLCYIIQKVWQAKSLVVHMDHLKGFQRLRPLKSWVTVGVDKMQTLVEPPLLDQAAEEEVRLLTPLRPEPGNGPPGPGPVEDIEESLLEQAGRRKWGICQTHYCLCQVIDLLKRVRLRWWWMGKWPIGPCRGDNGALSTPNFSFAWSRRFFGR